MNCAWKRQSHPFIGVFVGAGIIDMTVFLLDSVVQQPLVTSTQVITFKHHHQHHDFRRNQIIQG